MGIIRNTKSVKILLNEFNNDDAISVIELIRRLNTKLNKADAVGTEIKTDNDPVVVENKKVDANADFYNALAQKVRNKFNKTFKFKTKQDYNLSSIR